LNAILTSQFIIEIGCQVKQSLLAIAKCYNDSEIYSSLKSKPGILELGQHAKLKGAVTNPATPLDVLVNAVLKKSFTLLYLGASMLSIHNSFNEFLTVKGRQLLLRQL
jgi:hypothetical protein